MTLDLTSLTNATLLITGGTGMIGKWMIDYLLDRVECNIIVTGRSESKFNERFADTFAKTKFAKGRLHFLAWDPSHPSQLNGCLVSVRSGEDTASPQVASNNQDTKPHINYILHLASNTHPVAYATDPVSTIVMNVNATKELLDLAVENQGCRFVYASSVEIYGQNRGDCEKFTEDYCGYINSNTLRAGYPESKRCGEALCQAYIKQYGVDVVIPRIARVYGPTLLKTDTKALSQFIANALAGQDIVLKSEGKQHFSYLHVADAVTGILAVMLKGKCGEAYNIADEKSDITLRDLAALIAGQAGRKVIFDLPDAAERAGFSPAMLARLESEKVNGLGWRAQYDIADGIAETIKKLGACNG